jgi:hypothetical protein
MHYYNYKNCSLSSCLSPLTSPHVMIFFFFLLIAPHLSLCHTGVHLDVHPVNAVNLLLFFYYFILIVILGSLIIVRSFWAFDFG